MSNPTNELLLTGAVEYGEVVSSQASSLLTMGTILAPTYTPTEKRAAVDLICVIDKSGSMAGTKIELTKQTLQFVIKQLDADDQFAVVLYDSNVSTLIPLTKMTPQAKQDAGKRVAAIQPGSCTCLSGGLLEGLTIATKRTVKNAVCSVLLFTDGLANEGITDKAQLERVTRQAVQQVGSPCTVFTFGFGADHDPDMLRMVAAAGQGVYYYIENADKIPLSFADCLGGLQSVVAQNIKLTITGLNNTMLNKVLNDVYATSNPLPGTSVTVTLGDLYSEEQRDILVDVQLPALQEPLERFEAVRFSLEYFDVISASLKQSCTSVYLRRPFTVSPNVERNQALVEQRSRLMVVEEMQRSKALADAGRLEEARSNIRLAKAKIMEDVAETSPMYSAMQTELDEIDSTMVNQTAYVAMGSKVLSSRAMQHQYQRGSNDSELYTSNAKKTSKMKWFSK